MALTKTQLDRVLEAIKRHFNSFTYEAIGERALTTAELDSLKSLGLARESVRNLVADPLAVGRLVALIPPSVRRSLSLDDVLKRAKEVLPQTAVERRAIEYAQEHAGTYISGIRDMTLRDATAATARSRTAALRAVRSGVSNAIATRQTRSELKTSLFDAIDNKTRDWQRIAHTEINNAIQNGIHGEILDEGGPDQMVYKRPAPDACIHCKRLFLKDEGTPRIFRVKSLDDSNVGRKAAEWEPTIGSVHPWCFTAGHKILTNLGNKLIEDVCAGDMVMTHRGRLRRVTATASRDWSGDLVEIEASGRILRCTPEHPFLRGDKVWVLAANLREGDHLVEIVTDEIVAKQILKHFSDKIFVKNPFWHVEPPLFRRSVIVRLRRQSYSGLVFNFAVEDDNSYVCEGVVAHNCNCQLHVVPEGYEFAKIRVVKQPFEFDDVEYRAGQAVSEGVFARLGPTEQSKIGFDSTLKYTGVSATPDVEKSFKVSHTSDDCFCEH